MLKKLSIGLVVAVLLGVTGLGYVVWNEQRADYSWDPGLKTPTFASNHPVVVVDQAHNNASTIGLAGRYWPFGRLLRADGFEVQKGTEKFTPDHLERPDILVIANASGASKPNILGINVPIGSDGDRGAPAFSADEVAAVVEWVSNGGSLLLIADHAPFGAASASLADAFGVAMCKGFVEIEGEPSDPLVFSSENGRLGEHPIITGRGSEEQISRVMTFTGQSLNGPDSAAILLRLPENAIEYVAPSDWKEGMAFVPRSAGTAQGLALKYGQGRVVVLGEAAMLTAQVYDGQLFGMNAAGNDNKQFAINIMHWLAGVL